jgi:hypothetical protein
VFTGTEGHYTLAFPDAGIEFDLDRLRRDRHELIGELSVRCDLAGARTVDGTLSIGTFNVSSPTARRDRGRMLADLARTKPDEIHWHALLEVLCQLVLAAERQGQPSVSLRDLARPADEHEELTIDGIRLLLRHPVVFFGDGGAAKSYIALYLAARLSERGLRVGLFDWELSGEDHRDRLERLCGPDMPDIRYVRCDRPLVHEADRLRRIVRHDGIDYAVYDSIAFACDGPPEAAESASTYYRATRQIGIGSAHVAHTTKAEGGDAKPFGSVFWHNGARATWHVKLASDTADHEITVGLYNRKANLGPLRPAVGFCIEFSEERTLFRRTDIASNDELAAKLPLWQRMQAELRRGPRTLASLAEDLGANVDSLDRTVRRHAGHFLRVPSASDGVTRIALVDRRPQ